MGCTQSRERTEGDSSANGADEPPDQHRESTKSKSPSPAGSPGRKSTASAGDNGHSDGDAQRKSGATSTNGSPGPNGAASPSGQSAGKTDGKGGAGNASPNAVDTTPTKRNGDSGKPQSAAVEADLAVQLATVAHTLLVPFDQHLKDTMSGDVAGQEIEWSVFVRTTALVLQHILSACHDELVVAFEQAVSSGKVNRSAEIPRHGAIEVVDERMYKLLESWCRVVGSGAASATEQQVCDLLERVSVGFLPDVLSRYRSSGGLPPKNGSTTTASAAAKKKKKYTFGDVATLFVAWSDNDELRASFDQLSQGEPTVNADRLSSYLNTLEQDTTTLGARTMMATVFANALTYRRFASFFGNSSTNGILDPQRSTTVWQDMTLPLPNYVVHTRAVASDAAVRKALHDGARALIMNVRADRKGAPVLVGKPNAPKVTAVAASVRTALEAVREQAFVVNPLPVVLVIPPGPHLTVALQDRLAEILIECLGPLIARGPMFDGASSSDPHFSPAALQHKVLILSTQAPLKPFVGLFVADMARNGLGVRVTDVKPRTPAAKAGITKDDWITHVNGVSVADKQDLKGHLRGLRLGDTVTLKKENLTEMKLTVGGAIDHDDPKYSRAFSDVVFLRFNLASASASPESRSPGAGSPVSAGMNAACSAEWETAALGPDDVLHGAEFAHFALVQNCALGQKTTVETERVVATADSAGAQFIDCDSSPTAEQWARGKFVENARCGYVLKDVEDGEPFVPVHYSLTVRTVPQSMQRDAGAGEDMMCLAASLSSFPSGVNLSSPTTTAAAGAKKSDKDKAPEKGTDGKSPSPPAAGGAKGGKKEEKGRAGIRGAAGRRLELKEVTGHVYGHPESEIHNNGDKPLAIDVLWPHAVLLLSLEFKNGKESVFETALPASLLRSGKRVMTVWSKNNPKEMLSIVCDVERTNAF